MGMLINTPHQLTATTIMSQQERAGSIYRFTVGVLPVYTRDACRRAVSLSRDAITESG